MQLNTRNAQPQEKTSTVKAIIWCQRNNALFAGLPYTLSFDGHGGAHIKILAPQGTDRLNLEQALQEAYRELAFLFSHDFVICPVEWFAEAKEQLAVSKLEMVRRP